MEIGDLLYYEFINSDFIQHSGWLYTAMFGLMGYYFKTNYQNFFKKLFRNFYYTVTVKENTDIFNTISKYFEQEYGDKFRNVLLTSQKKSFSDYQYEKNTDNDEIKKYKMRFLPHNDSITFFKDNMFMRMSVDMEEVKGAKDIFNNEMVIFGLTAYGWRPKDRMIKLYQNIIETAKQNIKKDEVTLYTNENDWWNEVKTLRPKTLDNIINDKKDEICADIEEFLDNKEKYIKRGVPYKRTFIFYGKPGTGKTSIILALAQKYNKDVYIMNLETVFGSSAFMTLWNQIPENALLLIEEIDINIEKRNVKENKVDLEKDEEFEEVKSHIGLTTIMNCMDGVFYREGLLTMITTNHIDKLDHALVRPGRIDKKIEIGNSSPMNIMEYIENYYNITVGNRDEIIKRDLLEKFAMSAIQEFCLVNKTYEPVIDMIWK